MNDAVGLLIGNVPNSHTQNISIFMPTDNILVIAWYFNLGNKSYLIIIIAGFNTIFDHSALVFWATLYFTYLIQEAEVGVAVCRVTYCWSWCFLVVFVALAGIKAQQKL